MDLVLEEVLEEAMAGAWALGSEGTLRLGHT